MAEGKKSFVLYCDLLHTVEKLPNEKAGELFKHILQYVNDLDPKTDDLIIELSFEPIKQNLKRTLKKWEEIKLKRSESGRLGGLKSGETRSKNEANEANASKMKQNEANEAVSVNGNVSVINNNIPDSVEKIDWDMLIVVFNKIFGTKVRLINDDTKRKFKARIKSGWTKDEIKNAMFVVQKDKFHIDNNFKYVTLEYFSRDKTLQLYGNKNSNELPRDIQPRVID